MQKSHIKKISRIRGLFSTTTIYSVDDHLLIEKNTGYTAHYQRFFYDDIISLLIYRHPRWKKKLLLDALLAALAILIVGLLLIKSATFPDVVIISLIISPLWLFFIFDIVLGPTALAEVRTVTSTEYFPLARRYKKSQKVLRRIQDIIEKSQGMLEMGTLNGNQLSYKSPPLAARPSLDHDRREENALPASKYSLLYSFFLALLLAEVIISSIQFKWEGSTDHFLAILSVMIILFNVIILFKQKRLRIRKPLRVLSWVSFIIFLSDWLFNSALLVLRFVEHGPMLDEQMLSLTNSAPHIRIFKIIYIAAFALCFILGIIFSIKGHYSLYLRHEG